MFSGNLFSNFSWASCEISIRFCLWFCRQEGIFFVGGIAVQVLVEIPEGGNKKKGGLGFFRGEEEEEEEVEGLW